MEYNTRKKRLKLKHCEDSPHELFDKVIASGGPHGFGLEGSGTQADDAYSKESGVHGRRSTTGSCSTLDRIRLFDDPSARERKTLSASVNMKYRSSSRNPHHPGKPNGRSSGAPFALGRTPAKSKSGPGSANHVVCAISENLARETCVASIDAGSPVSLMVTKHANGQTYAETLAYLQVLQPDEVLLNEGRRNSQLATKVLQLYMDGPSIRIPFESGRTREYVNDERIGDSRLRAGELTAVVKYISRSYFDQTKGSELLQRVVREETYDASCSEEYILLSSSYALLHYIQQCLGANFSKNSLHLTINSGGSNRMTIDRSSVFQLELLANARTGKMRNSLIGTIDCTKTTVGGRLLRANLMSPPTRTDTINSRLDLVDAFLSDEEFFYTVLEHLQTLPDIDKMLSNLALVPWKKTSKRDAIMESETITERMANKGISALVCVKSTLTALPAFADALENRFRKLERGNQDNLSYNENHVDVCGSPDSGRRSILIGLGGTGPTMVVPQRHHLLKALITTMRQQNLIEVLKLVSNVFTESTSFSRNPNAMRHHACFALKAESNGMMEICRKAFLENVDNIYKLADEYAEAHSMHVTVKHTTARGYFLSIPVEHASDLAQVFIQPARGGKAISCTTEQVNSLNLRAQENVQDLLLMTHEKIQEVLDFARSRYDAFAALSDAVALLDMCHSFADVVALSRLPWCRPIVCDIGESGASNSDEVELTIVNGRYAIETTNSALIGPNCPGEFIPNDTFASTSQHFTVITGINGSGKSTYLKQVAIIVLLAHCGSYVPAQKATIPIVERLCTRIGTTDDQEHNISTFLLEMKETAFICQNASPKSLILIDELGRATSNEDGVAIAWAVSECLLMKQAMTFFVTHYPQLCALSEIYPSVQNQHLEAEVSEEGEDVVLYTHRLIQGPCLLSSNYGVEMAESCGWPQDVLIEARRLRSAIESKLTQGGTSNVRLTKNIQNTTHQAMDYLTGIAGSLKKLACTDEDFSVIRSKLEHISKSAKMDDRIVADGAKRVLVSGCDNQNSMGMIRPELSYVRKSIDDSGVELRAINHKSDSGSSWTASSANSLMASTSEAETSDHETSGGCSESVSSIDHTH